MAVGSYLTSTTHVHTLAEQWNGISWAIETVSSPSGTTYGTLGGVSCTSTSACAAVGGYSTATGAFQADKLLAVQWNGTKFGVKTTPSPSGTTFATFTGVSCTGPGACTADGGISTSSAAQLPSAPLAERWNGSSWKIQATPNPVLYGFSADSCAAATACTAVGSFMFAEGWDGTSWSTQTLAQPSPLIFDAGGLTGVSCAAPSTCTAAGTTVLPIFFDPEGAGEFLGSDTDVPLAERSAASAAPPGPGGGPALPAPSTQSIRIRAPSAHGPEIMQTDVAAAHP
jgi:hypothetical protein